MPIVVPSQAKGNSESLKKNINKRYYGCFRSKKAGILGLSAILLILVTMFILLFFLLPRAPTVSIQNVSKPMNLNVVAQNNILFAKSDLDVTVAVFNPGYKKISVDNVFVTSFWMVKGDSSSTTKYPFGEGVVKSVQIDSKTSQTIKITFKLFYQGNYKTDPVYMDFLARCTDPTSSNRIIEMAYHVTANGSSVKAVHSISCPVTIAQTNEIFKNLESSNGNLQIPLNLA